MRLIVHAPLLNPIEKRLALIDHMNRVKLQRFITDHFEARMRLPLLVEMP